MDWSKQSEEMMRQWSAAQKQWWSSVKELTQTGGAAPAKEMWDKTVEAWENSVGQTLEAQSQWFEAWLGQMTDQANVPPEMQQWLEQGRAMSSQWQQTSQSMWQEWFDLAREANISGWGDALQQGGMPVVDLWRQMTQQALNAQMEMLKSWLPGAEKSAE